MAEARPELVFLKGPQAGQKAVLMTDVAVAGRQAGVDIVLAEQYASRQHFKFENSPDGWVIENLSANGTRINGKLYKTGKKLILDTGDVIAVASETEILFVAPGDNPDDVVREYRKKNPPAVPQQPVAAAEQNTPQVGKFNAPPPPPAKSDKPKFNSPPPGKSEVVATPSGRPTDGVSAVPQLSPAELQVAKKKSKMRIYMIGGGIYALLMVGVVIWLSSSDTPSPSAVSSSDKPSVLTEKEISNVFNNPLLPTRGPSIEGARNALSLAKSLYGNTARPENLYYCVYYFKLYQAYQPEREGKSWDNPIDEEHFESAKKQLIEEIKTKYINAIALENQKLYDQANRLFDELLTKHICQNNASEDKEVVEILVKNFRDHLNYAGKLMTAQKKKKSKW